jgi:hypothetical protein
MTAPGPKKKNPHDTANSFENAEIYRSLRAADAGQEADTSDEVLLDQKRFLSYQA